MSISVKKRARQKREWPAPAADRSAKAAIAIIYLSIQWLTSTRRRSGSGDLRRYLRGIIR
jgi:hypothetical protein